MKFRAFIVAEAEADIADIHRYVLLNDSPRKAEDVFRQLQKHCESLATFPGRGHVPPELERVGVHGYREIHFKPYRIIYEAKGKDVFVHCVLDGRRTLQDLLERRLIR